MDKLKRSPKGLAFIGKLATNSYRMAVRETKERLKGILAVPDSFSNWHDVKAVFDRGVAEDQKKETAKASDFAQVLGAAS